MGIRNEMEGKGTGVIGNENDIESQGMWRE